MNTMLQQLDPGLVAGRRAKRLEQALVAMTITAVGMLATLVLPWLILKVPAQMAQLPNGTTIAIKGGTVTRTGLAVGMLSPMMVNLGIAAVCALCAWKRWWYVNLAAMAVLLREGIGVPLPIGRGAVSMAITGIGLSAVRVLWPLMLCLIGVATLQAMLVRRAEAEARAADNPGTSGAALVGVLGRVMGAMVREVRQSSGSATKLVTAPAASGSAATETSKTEDPSN